LRSLIGHTFLGDHLRGSQIVKGLRGEPTPYSYESHKIFTGGLRIESTAS
jgi:hypothetical protein